MWLFSLINSYLCALPQTFQTLSGNAQAIYFPNGLEVRVDSDRATLAWDDFSIASHEQVHFLQASENQCVLNRILGSEPSQIFGSLTSNGQLILINPNGILFGRDAKIDVGSLIASTLDLKSADFLDQDCWGFSNDSMARIDNFSTILSEGDLVFLSVAINNEGALMAPRGSVSIGAGGKILFRPHEERRIAIQPSSDLGFRFENSGLIQAEKVEISLEGNLSQLAFHHSGNIDVLGAEGRKGEIFLTVPRGDVLIEGGAFSARNDDGSGGRIHIFGQRIALTENSLIDVSAVKGGGEILLGGDFQGRNTYAQNAESLYVGPETLISANALEQGNGGRTIVWADKTAQFLGYLSAQGGPEGGDGGFVEISGKDVLDFNGVVNCGAVKGIRGTLLLDPVDVTISTAANANIAAGNLPTPPPVVANPYTVLFNGAPATATINTTALQNALGVNDVIVNAAAAGGGTGNITVNNAVTWATANSLTLNSANDITVNGGANITVTGAGGTGNITFTASRNITILANVQQQNATAGAGGSGNVTITATTGSIQINQLAATQSVNVSARKGTTTVSAPAGDVILFGGNTATEFTAIGERSFPAGVNQVGDIIVSAGRDVIMQGGTITNASTQIGHLGVAIAIPAGSSVTSNITVTAGRDISLTGGSGIQAGSQIGHAGNGMTSAALSTNSAIGNINVSAGRNLTLLGGASGANNRAAVQIGHGGPGAGLIGFTLTGNITASAASAVLLQGSSGTRSSAHIGHVGAQAALSATSIVSGNISVSGGTTLTLQGGTIVGANTLSGAQIGHGGPGATTSASSLSGTITATATLDILLQGGSGTRATAQIGHIGTQMAGAALVSSATGNISVTAGRNLTLQGGSGLPVNHQPGAQIGHGGIGATMTGLSLTGNTTVTAGAIVSLQGGPGDGGCSQIGFAGRSSSLPTASSVLTGDISVTAGTDLFMQGGTGPRSSTQVGHIAAESAPAANVTVLGNITLTSARDMTMTARDIGQSGAHVGHADFTGIAPTIFTMTGNTAVNIGRNYSAQIGSQASVVIGTQRLGNYTGLITILCGGNFVTWCNAAGPFANNTFLVGNAGFPAAGINSLRQTLRMYVAGNLCVDGRISSAQFRPFNNGTNASFPPETIIHVGGNMTLIAGPTADAAVVNQGTPGMNFYREIFVGGTIRCYNGAPAGMSSNTNIGASLFYSYNGLAFGSPPSIGEVNIRAGGDVFYAGRYNFGPPFNIPPIFTSTQNLTMIADNPFASSALWTAQSVIVGGSNIFSGSALSSNSPAIPSDGFGAVILDANGYNFTQAAFPAGPNCINLPLFPAPAISFPFTVVNNFANINIQSRDRFTDGSLATINLGTDPNFWRLNATAGDVVVQGHHNSQLTNTAMTATGSVIHLVQNNMTMTGGVVTAGQNVDLILDNQAPSAPLIGPGAFNMNATSQISSTAGYIRVYTALQSQNNIDAAAQFISGGVPSTFTAGELFVDTATEQWCTYYPNGGGGVPFRIFYKDCLQILAAQATLIIDQLPFDFSFDMNWPYYGMEEYYGWPTKFYLIYQLASWKPPYEDIPPEPYFIRRRKMLLFAPREDRLGVRSAEGFSRE
jgi:filamentous hemagglutinin family protein